MRRFLRQSAPVRLAIAAVLLFVFATGFIFAAKVGVQLLHPPIATLIPASVTQPPPTLKSLSRSATSLPPPPTATQTSTPMPPTPTVFLIVTIAPSATPRLPTPTSVPTTAIPAPVVPSATLTLVPTATPTTVTPTFTPDPTMPITIVVEGPVQSISGNTIIIFDLTIVLNATDLASVHVGDTARVEGYYAANSQVIIAVYVTVLRNTSIPSAAVETNPSTGQVWTDPGNCSNPPPPWAPANGWRRRCQSAPSPGDSGGNGMGMGD